jgi:hypothetical protein
MAIQWIQQEDEMGCVLACLAMVMGRTYSQVKTDFVCFDGRGLCHEDAYEYLADNGFAVAKKFKGRNYVHPPADKYNYDKEWRTEWPPAPFAEVHLCLVECHEKAPAHMVVMLGDGRVLDPVSPQPRTLANYHRVCNVAGVVAFGLEIPATEKTLRTCASSAKDAKRHLDSVLEMMGQSPNSFNGHTMHASGAKEFHIVEGTLSHNLLQQASEEVGVAVTALEGLLPPRAALPLSEADLEFWTFKPRRRGPN